MITATEGGLMTDTGHDYTNLSLEERSGVLHVVLDRPDQLNAMNGPLHRELASLVTTLRGRDDLGAVVLTGRGRAFCAGGDAKWFNQAGVEEVEEMFRDGRTLILDLLDVPVPVIAAVNGPAVGFGATLALFCDVVIADENATFSDPHVHMGVVAGDGGAIIWPLRIGMRAKRLLLTGEPIDAPTAERLGLIDEVVGSGTSVQEATAMAERFAAGPRRALAGTKAAVNQVLRQAVAAGFDLGLQLERDTFASADHREAVAAFTEGRPPRFTGR
jgi:enoyl-CoA hydratase